ncbi:NADH-ubiquinone reductase complex 1 MLRQ subunit [Jimgerdemannia flammicorona]|uniref:NADH-ubiquinone reductase complex 1 MLRQ subunit n=1 Tax=Jimgerdemannia flammicorona TaxID=994334 RepID=A0A433Q2S8_9FUNG|nr:NADH-ubiquinone reductase complex 1 MLRQ subunit [Jimgerdemannia flammicorona]
MSAIQFIAKNPALAPLFVIGGAGIGGALYFMYHELRHHPDVTVNRRSNPYPWQRVEQHHNTKFITVNKDFFESRKNISNKKY